MTRPTVSIVTACYRSRAYIERACASLAAQTVAPLEWLAVDDASPDDTGLKLERLAANAPFPVVVVRQPVNSGAVPSIERGISMARAEFTLILDQDDELVASSIERLCQAWRAEGRPRYSGVGARCVDQHGTFIGTRFPGRRSSPTS